MPSTSPVAVVIPVYNRPVTIFRALTSLVHQTQPPKRLVIVDDGSSDDTAARIEGWCKTTKTPFTKQLIKAEHQGAAAARNKGITAVRDCDFVLFLDSDDEIPSDFFARTVPLLAQEEKVVAVSIPRVVISEKSLIFNDMKEFAKSPILWLFLRGAGIASCSLLRLATVRAAKGFDEHITSGHDLALFARISLKGIWQIVEGGPSLIYRNGFEVGEEENLSEHYWNRFADWASAREYILNNLLSADSKNSRYWFDIIASLWYRAAREADKSGQKSIARIYYLKALKYSILVLRFPRRLGRSFARLARVLLFLARSYLAIPYYGLSRLMK